jgi:hypothetical protein
MLMLAVLWKLTDVSNVLTATIIRAMAYFSGNPENEGSMFLRSSSKKTRRQNPETTM